MKYNDKPIFPFNVSNVILMFELVDGRQVFNFSGLMPQGRNTGIFHNTDNQFQFVILKTSELNEQGSWRWKLLYYLSIANSSQIIDYKYIDCTVS